MLPAAFVVCSGVADLADAGPAAPADLVGLTALQLDLTLGFRANPCWRGVRDAVGDEAVVAEGLDACGAAAGVGAFRPVAAVERSERCEDHGLPRVGG